MLNKDIFKDIYKIKIFNKLTETCNMSVFKINITYQNGQQAR